MIRGTLTILTFLSVLLFPWPLAVLLSLAAALFEPLVPLAAGLLADTLYYAPAPGALPLFTLGGAFLSLLAFLVRRRLNTSIIGE